MGMAVGRGTLRSVRPILLAYGGAETNAEATQEAIVG